MSINPVTNFRNARNNFIARMRELTARINSGQLTPAGLAQARALAAEGVTVGKRLDTVENVIRGFEKTIGVSLGGFGFLPALAAVPSVVITAIAGVSYLLSKFMDKIGDFFGRADYIKQRTAEGATVEQASREYAAQNPKSAGLFGEASQLVWPLVIVGGLYLYATRKGR